MLLRPLNFSTAISSMNNACFSRYDARLVAVWALEIRQLQRPCLRLNMISSSHFSKIGAQICAQQGSIFPVWIDLQQKNPRSLHPLTEHHQQEMSVSPWRNAHFLFVKQAPPRDVGQRGFPVCKQVQIGNVHPRCAQLWAQNVLT